MTTTTAPPPEEAVTKRLFTVEEVLRLEGIGIFADDERIELIDGEICRMTPIGQRHNKAVTLLIELLARLAIDRKATLAVQGPAELGRTNLPQPDVLVLNRSYLSGERHPSPDQVLLLIEVSESTLRLDRTVKLSLYARAGIREYWIVNLQDNVLEVHREPDSQSGGYLQDCVVNKGESISPLAFPDFSIAVSEILP